MPKIAIVSPSLKVGGIERALSVLANHFVSSNLEVVFISCLRGKGFYKLDARVRPVGPDFTRKSGLRDKLIFYPRIVKFIRKSVIREKPDAVLSFGDVFNPLVLLALRGSGIPIFISDRTSPDYHFKFPIPLLKKCLYPQSAGFIAQTARAADFKEKYFGNKLNIKVIPNAIREVKTYPEVPRENVILYLGRFAWEKAPDRLIKAFAQINKRAGWQLHMAGAGPMLSEMKELAQQLGVGEEVIFPGEVDNVDKLFARASIFVLPSVLEGFPNSLCEAMAAGLPVICYDSIPYEDILVPGESGLVIKESGAKTLASELEVLMHDSIRREKIGSEAASAISRLSTGKVASEYLDFMGLQ